MSNQTTSTVRPAIIVRLFTVILFLCAGIATVPAVGIIGFNISSPKYNNLMTAGDYAGAPGARTNNWNNMLASFDGSSADITLPDGSVSNSAGNVVSGMSVVFHPTSSGGGVYNRGSGTFTNDSKMFIDVNDSYGCSGFSQFGYIDVTNIPYANYNIYCYFRPDNGSGSSHARGGFWVVTNTPTGAQRYYIQNQSNDVAQTQEPVPSNTGGNYVQTYTTSIPSGGASWSSIDGGNYAEFSNLTNSSVRVWFGGLGNGSGAVDDLGNYVNGGDSHVRFKVTGFQIVQIPSGQATALYLQDTNLTLHAGNPVGRQLTVLADLDTGATGVDKTTAAGITYSVSDPNVATVSSTGLLAPGTNGMANLIVSYQGVSLTNQIKVIGPTSLSISLTKTNLLVGNGQGDTTATTLYANFSDANHVVVNGYKFVSFAGTTGIVSASTNGMLTAVGPGTFSVTGTYDGISTTANNVGQVSSYTPPVGAPSFAVKFTDGSHDMSFHDLSGAPGARFAYWNNLVEKFGNVTNKLANPYDSQGNLLPGTLIQQEMQPEDAQSFYTTGPVTTNESIMFGVYPDVGMNNGLTVLSTLVVSNVPYSSYDVYCYVENDNSSNGTNRPGEVIIDGVTQYRINSMSQPNFPNNNGSGYVEASPQPVGLPASVTDVPFGNYVKFSGVTNKNLTVSYGAVGQDWIGDAASVTRMRVTGIQIVKSLVGLTATNLSLTPVAVPALLPADPATFALTVLGDFTDGTKGGNITSLPGITYASSNTNVFLVNTNGVITTGLTPGVANLTVAYQANTLVVSVTNLAPTSVKVEATPNTVYLDSVLGVQPANAKVVASFPGHSQVNVTGFNGISFVDQGSSAATLNSDGSITANAQGTANLGADYLGTTYVTPNAFTVSSINNPAILKHLYTFTNTTAVIDSVGGANGTVYPPLSTNKPIVLDGSRAVFPGDGSYADCPYIALPSGLINQMGDVSIVMWCGRSQLNTWARYFSFGSTTKGTDPHNAGSGISGMQMMDSYGSTGTPDFQFQASGWKDLKNTFNFTNDAEYQVVTILAPNAGEAYLYVNGSLITNEAPAAAYLSTSVNDTVDWLGVSLYADAPLAGWINQLGIYEGVLTPSQVAANYAAGKSVFLPPATVSSTVVPMTFNTSGGNLNLSWPPDHKGWTLQVQTNSLSNGLGTNWVDVSGSTTTTNMSLPVTPADGSVFYRLKYQP